MSLEDPITYCSICYSEGYGEMVSGKCNAQGNFCRHCLTMYLRAAIEMRQMNGDGALRCPCHSCDSLFTQDDIFEFFMVEERMNLLEKYLYFTDCIAAETDPLVAWCSDCSRAVRGQGSKRIVTCPTCENAFCRECGEAHASFMPCSRSDSSFTNWQKSKNILASEGVKKCPRCKYIIEKNGGCNHMTCRHCNHEFCWRCSRDYRGGCTGGTQCDLLAYWNSPFYQNRPVTRVMSTLMLGTVGVGVGTGLAVAGAGLALAGGTLYVTIGIPGSKLLQKYQNWESGRVTRRKQAFFRNNGMVILVTGSRKFYEDLVSSYSTAQELLAEQKEQQQEANSRRRRKWKLPSFLSVPLDEVMAQERVVMEGIGSDTYFQQQQQESKGVEEGDDDDDDLDDREDGKGDDVNNNNNNDDDDDMTGVQNNRSSSRHGSRDDDDDYDEDDEDDEEEDSDIIIEGREGRFITFVYVPAIPSSNLNTFLGGLWNRKYVLHIREEAVDAIPFQPNPYIYSFTSYNSISQNYAQNRSFLKSTIDTYVNYYSFDDTWPAPEYSDVQYQLSDFALQRNANQIDTAPESVMRRFVDEDYPELSQMVGNQLEQIIVGDDFMQTLPQKRKTKKVLTPRDLIAPLNDDDNGDDNDNDDDNEGQDRAFIQIQSQELALTDEDLLDMALLL